MRRVIEISKSEGIPTFEAANKLALSRIEEARRGKADDIRRCIACNNSFFCSKGKNHNILN